LEQFEGVLLIVYRRHPTYLRSQDVFVKCLDIRSIAANRDETKHSALDPMRGTQLGE